MGWVGGWVDEEDTYVPNGLLVVLRGLHRDGLDEGLEDGQEVLEEGGVLGHCCFVLSGRVDGWGREA